MKNIISKISWRKSFKISKELYKDYCSSFLSYYDSEEYKNREIDRDRLIKKLIWSIIFLSVSILYIFLMLFSFKNTLINVKIIMLVLCSLCTSVSILGGLICLDGLGLLKLFKPIERLIVKVKTISFYISTASIIDLPITILIDDEKKDIQYIKKQKVIVFDRIVKSIKYKELLILLAEQENEKRLLVLELGENTNYYLESMKTFYNIEFVEYSSLTGVIMNSANTNSEHQFQ